MKTRSLLLFWVGLIAFVGSNALSAPIDAPINPANYPNGVKVACVGDSITAGAGASNPGVTSYPAVLASLLGAGYTVSNFGVSGTTMLKNGDFSYWKQPQMAQADAFAPDVVVLMLGTNDSKAQNWKLKDQFATDARAMVDHFLGLPSKPRVWLCLPPPVYGNGAYGIVGSIIQNEIIPILKTVAADANIPTIDVFSGMNNHPELFPDTVHPNDAGYSRLANIIYGQLTGAPTFNPSGDLFLKNFTVKINEPFPDWKVRYTVDGTTPVATSPLYVKPITMNYDVTIRAKAFGPDGASSPMNFATFTRAVLRPSENVANTDPGLSYSYYEGSIDDIANPLALTPVKVGVSAQMDLSGRNRDVNFRFVYSGYVKIPADGIYHFYTTSDDGSQLSIGDTLVVDNGGMHGMQEMGGKIALKAGLQPIKLFYYQGGGGFGLEVRYEGPDLPKQIIPASALCYDAGK